MIEGRILLLLRTRIIEWGSRLTVYIGTLRTRVGEGEHVNGEATGYYSTDLLSFKVDCTIPDCCGMVQSSKVEWRTITLKTFQKPRPN